MPQQHNSKQMKKMLRELEKVGFVISEKSKSGTVQIMPPESIPGPVYFTHATESSFHQMRRDFAKLYGVVYDNSNKAGKKILVNA